jgi:hypothetical protein
LRLQEIAPAETAGFLGAALVLDAFIFRFTN